MWIMQERVTEYRQVDNYKGSFYTPTVQCPLREYSVETLKSGECAASLQSGWRVLPTLVAKVNNMTFTRPKLEWRDQKDEQATLFTDIFIFNDWFSYLSIRMWQFHSRCVSQASAQRCKSTTTRLCSTKTSCWRCSSFITVLSEFFV